MLGLGSSLGAGSTLMPKTLPVGSNYIQLEVGKEVNDNITGEDGEAPETATAVISPDEMVFDDTEWEQYGASVNGRTVYAEVYDSLTIGSMNPSLKAGDSVTLSGKITKAFGANAGDTYDCEASSVNGNILFTLNSNTADGTQVHIDEDNTATISGINKEVNSSGVFTRTFTLAADYIKLTISAGDVGIVPADNSEDPGVRISDLLLVKN